MFHGHGLIDITMAGLIKLQLSMIMINDPQSVLEKKEDLIVSF